MSDHKCNCCKKNALYIGAGLDTSPMLVFNCIKDWICIDAFPLYPEYMLPDFKHNTHNLQLEWLQYLIYTYKLAGFETSFTNKDYYNNEIVFHKSTTKQTITYYYNTPIDQYQSIPIYLQNKLKNCEVLVVKGMHPDKLILNYLPKKIAFIGSSNLTYVQPVNKKNSIFYTKNIQSFTNRISSIYIIQHNEHLNKMENNNCIYSDTNIPEYVAIDNKNMCKYMNKIYTLV